MYDVSDTSPFRRESPCETGIPARRLALDGAGGPDPVIAVREYGSSGPTVVVLHGGPGAPGYMAPVARELERSFRVLEPFQRRSGGELLTVARHVADLREVVTVRCGGGRPALVGSSWGAMLALAYAAEHPEDGNPLVLVGCGTFDRVSRAHFADTVAERTGGETRERLDRLETEVSDPDERLSRTAELLLPAYSYDLVTTELESVDVDRRGNLDTWHDMLRLQAEGVYPAAFSAVGGPVLMIHGVRDPHPGAMTRATLAAHISHLEYVELERCGHYPWLERYARDEFFRVLLEWLGRRAR